MEIDAMKISAREIFYITLTIVRDARVLVYYRLLQTNKLGLE